jgi:sterol O-acyltransferase
MVAASFIPLTVLIIIDNYNKYGELLDIKTFWKCFEGIDKVLVCWWLLTLVEFSVVPLVYYTIKMELTRWVWVPLYVLQQAVLLCLPSMCVEMFQPGFGACMIIMIEGARMMMKSHSYFRNKILYCTDN